MERGKSARGGPGPEVKAIQALILNDTHLNGRDERRLRRKEGEVIQ